MKERWEAGELGCARLVVELRRRIDQLQPGDELEIVSPDPGAPTDLPAWCRMTGHELVSCEPPVYVIRRKGE